MRQQSQYQRVETVVHTIVGKPLAAIVFGLLVSGSFIVRKMVDYTTRLRNTPTPTEIKPAR